MDELFIESFNGPKGTAEVREVTDRDASGIEKVTYEIRFNGERIVAPSMGEASVIASDLAGDARFLNPGAQ